jgi:hypothetical protein
MTGRDSGRRPISPAWVAATIAAAMAWVLIGCTNPAPAVRTPASAATASYGRPIWLLTRSALALLAADPAVRAGFGRSQVYEILPPGQPPVPGVDATLVVTFTAVAALGDALAGHRLPAGTRAVLYDPEAWSFTPAAEQRDPAQAAARAAALAHAHGLKIIVAPALNLTTVLAPASSAPRWQQFLDLRLAAKIAEVADVLDLQAQSLERSPASYANFVREAAAQARAANPHVTVLAGLSTNPPGGVVYRHQLTAAIGASWPAVDGYWLNIPGRGPRCPTCQLIRPEVVIGAVRALANKASSDPR